MGKNSEIDKMVGEIIYLPRTLTEVGISQSAYSFLKTTGYFANHQLITKDLLLAAVSNHPEIIEDWLAWSENKRTSETPYFLISDSGGYEVGYYPDKGDTKKYQDKSSACADFIKREIESIRNGSTSDSEKL